MTQPSKSKFWTEAETQIMRDHFPNKPQAEMLAMLPGRSKTAVKAKAKDMGLRKTPQALIAINRANCRGKDLWSEEDVALLRRLWTTAPIEEVYPAFAPRRGKRAVARKAEAMKLKRPRAEVIRQLALAGEKGGAIKRAAKEEKVRVREQQAEESLKLQRVLSPVGRYGSPNLTMVMAHPLEAAWRGVA